MSEAVQYTLKRARVIFVMIFLMGTLFSFWGQYFFILNEPAQNVNFMTHVVFFIMATLSFLYGFRFVKNYTRTRALEIKKQELTKRKETMIMATTIQLLLIEFVCVIGISLAIFTQRKELIYPFYAIFLLGLYFSFPKADWYQSFLDE